MADVIIPIIQNAKVRIDHIKIFNNGAKQIEFLMTTRPVNTDGTLGAVMFSEIINVPVDANLVTIAPPADTIVEISEGVSVPVGDVPGALVYAWLQWFGETLCNSRKSAIEKLIKGEKEPEPEPEPIVEAEPDLNVNL